MVHSAHHIDHHTRYPRISFFYESTLFFTFGVSIGKSWRPGRIYRRVRIGVHVYLLEFF
jgi:hypothetical protein